MRRLAALASAALCCASAAAQPVPTLADAITRVRVQNDPTRIGPVGALSRDGRRFAFVTWQGDLARNTNVFRLMLLDLAAAAPPRALLTRDFAGDAANPSAAPFEQLAFLPDGRTLVFLGRLPDGRQQAFAIDIASRRLRQLTDSPASVREFVAADGSARLFSAALPLAGEAERLARIDGEGGFLGDEQLFNPARGFAAESLLARRQERLMRRYFLGGARPRPLADALPGALALDSRLRRFATLSASPDGAHALLYPYAPSKAPGYPLDAQGATWGLVALASGTVTVFADAPFATQSSANGGDRPVWSRDSSRVALFARPRGSDTPLWGEVTLKDRHFRAFGLPAGWKAIAWTRDGNGLIVLRDSSVARIARTADGWGPLRPIGDFPRLNWRWAPVSDGTTLIGLFEDLAMAPEIGAIDLATGAVRILTDLNPALRARRYARTVPWRWTNAYSGDASAFLTYPAGYRPGRRYPLVVLLDDQLMKRIERPYLLDAFMQLNGHAVQALANAGFLVLYTRDPVEPFIGSQECEKMREHIDSAIDRLDAEGLADPARIGISGWSRAAFHVECLLIHGKHRFAAASEIDGGTQDYATGKPYADAVLGGIGTPILFESHGLASIAAAGAMADRLTALGGAADLLAIPASAHASVRPRQRLVSLESHLGWWRYWLLGEDDPAISPKTVARWDAMARRKGRSN